MDSSSGQAGEGRLVEEEGVRRGGGTRDRVTSSVRVGKRQEAGAVLV